MALGAFTRDVAHIMASIVPVLMFATPIFYRLDQIDADITLGRHLAAAQHRRRLYRDDARVALDGNDPEHLRLSSRVVVVSYAVFIGGYQFFMRYKSVIVDVI